MGTLENGKGTEGTEANLYTLDSFFFLFFFAESCMYGMACVCMACVSRACIHMYVRGWMDGWERGGYVVV